MFPLESGFCAAPQREEVPLPAGACSNEKGAALSGTTPSFGRFHR